MNDLLFNINDDTEDTLTKQEKNNNDEPIKDDEDIDELNEDDTIVIENTRDNNHSILKETDLDMLESTINESSTNFLKKNPKDEIESSSVSKHGFSELLEKTGMNLLDGSSKIESTSIKKESVPEKIEIAASVVTPTPSTSGKSQTVLLQPSFIDNEKNMNKDKDESSSKVSKSGRKMVSLRKKKSEK